MTKETSAEVARHVAATLLRGFQASGAAELTASVLPLLEALKKSIRAAGSAAAAPQPDLVKCLLELVRDATAGDPIDGVRWTHKATRKLASALREEGFAVSDNTVGRLLKAEGYSLCTNRKHLARTHEPERDRQFRYIAQLRGRFQNQGNPAISIDTKKEGVGGTVQESGPNVAAARDRRLGSRLSQFGQRPRHSLRGL